MDALLKKLQVKEGWTIAVLRAPSDLDDLVDGFAADVTVKRRQGKTNDAVLLFVESCADIAERAPKVVEKLEGDALLWIAYPKKSSKKYDSDVGRDDSWQVLGDLGFEGVRQVAIDADWSALRFRRVEHIASMKRDPKRAMTKAGKKRTRKA